MQELNQKTLNSDFFNKFWFFPKYVADKTSLDKIKKNLILFPVLQTNAFSSFSMLFI